MAMEAGGYTSIEDYFEKNKENVEVGDTITWVPSAQQEHEIIKIVVGDKTIDTTEEYMGGKAKHENTNSFYLTESNKKKSPNRIKTLRLLFI